MLFADLLSLHLVAFLMFFILVIICIMLGHYLIKKKNQLDPSIDHELGEKSSKVLIIQLHHST